MSMMHLPLHLAKHNRFRGKFKALVARGAGEGQICDGGCWWLQRLCIEFREEASAATLPASLPCFPAWEGTILSCDTREDFVANLNGSLTVAAQLRSRQVGGQVPNIESSRHHKHHCRTGVTAPECFATSTG